MSQQCSKFGNKVHAIATDPVDAIKGLVPASLVFRVAEVKMLDGKGLVVEGICRLIA